MSRKKLRKRRDLCLNNSRKHKAKTIPLSKILSVFILTNLNRWPYFPTWEHLWDICSSNVSCGRMHFVAWETGQNFTCCREEDGQGGSYARLRSFTALSEAERVGIWLLALQVRSALAEYISGAQSILTGLN